MRRAFAALTIGWASLTVGCAGQVSPEGRRLLATADQAYRQGDDGRVVEAAGRFIKLHGRLEQAGEAYYLRGLARIRQGDPAVGEADLEKALAATRRKDLTALVHNALGEQAFQRGNLAAAEKHYQGGLANAPARASPSDQALYRLATILQRQGQWPEADVYFYRLAHLFEGSELAALAEERVQARRWSIQSAALTNAPAAQTMERRLRDQGMDARQDRVLRDGKLTYLIRVGSYPTFEAAQADLARVRKIRPDAFAVPAR